MHQALNNGNIATTIYQMSNNMVKLMDWMMEDGYGKLKEKAEQQEEWSSWTFRQKADNLKKEKNNMN